MQSIKPNIKLKNYSMIEFYYDYSFQALNVKNLIIDTNIGEIVRNSDIKLNNSFLYNYLIRENGSIIINLKDNKDMCPPNTLNLTLSYELEQFECKNVFPRLSPINYQINLQCLLIFSIKFRRLK